MSFLGGGDRYEKGKRALISCMVYLKKKVFLVYSVCVSYDFIYDDYDDHDVTVHDGF